MLHMLHPSIDRISDMHSVLKVVARASHDKEGQPQVSLCARARRDDYDSVSFWAYQSLSLPRKHCMMPEHASCKLSKHVGEQAGIFRRSATFGYIMYEGLAARSRSVLKVCRH